MTATFSITTVILGIIYEEIFNAFCAFYTKRAAISIKINDKQENKCYGM
jgi:hypothetical protein